MDFPYATEIVCLAMSIQGSMSVRNNNNNNSASSSNTNNNKRPPPPMNTFHAFIKSTLTAYAGATFTNVFMARPTAMLSNDIFFGSCILGFAVVNYVPYGYSLCNTFPILAIINILSQVFRISGIINYSDVAYHAFKEAPSAYYPMPIFGPILFPTLLGNMGGFIWYGIDGYLAQGGGGMPWLFQQGMACSTFYHFYAHDMHGSVGTTLRSIIHPTAVHIMSHVLANTTTTTTADSIIDIIDDNVLFAKLIIGTFMILMSILHLPQLLGPKFSPFTTMYNVVTTTGWRRMMLGEKTMTKKTTTKATKEKNTLSNPSSNDVNHGSSSKKKKQ